jgi:hypothetical protein
VIACLRMDASFAEVEFKVEFNLIFGIYQRK